MKTITDQLKDIDTLIPELPNLISKVCLFEAYMNQNSKDKKFARTIDTVGQQN